MTWAEGTLVSFDLETTGVDPENDRIVTATVVTIRPGQKPEIRDWLVDPGIEIPESASAIHGVTTEMARTDGIHLATAVAQIFAELDSAWSLGHPVIIYNAPYDLTMLDRELRRHCDTHLGEPGPVVDPFVIDKTLDKYRKGSRKLTDVCAHYGVRLDGAHTSSGDALAAARVAWRMAQVFPEVGEASLPELHARQTVWRRTWAADFEAYLVKKGTPETVDGSWPMRRVA